MTPRVIRRFFVSMAVTLTLAVAPTDLFGQTLAPWYHYFHSSNNHFYTTNWGELGGGGFGGWTYQGIRCYVVAEPTEGTHPLYRFYNTTYGKHFYTTYFNEVSGPSWVYEGISGYLFSTQVVGTVPLHRWYRWLDGPVHYYTTGSGNLSGWEYQGVIGYVSPS